MADTENSEYTRLHITPLTPALLPSILPPSLVPQARNISYHTLQSLPDKSYGYITLPTMDAEKLKKKLNGSILKGSKIRISEARPETPHTIDAEPQKEKREKKGKGKRKRDELPGVDIGERHVKRGWTTPAKEVKGKEEKVVNKSKFTTGPECLFRTVLPANVKSGVKEQKGKRGKKGETLVHEFAKTTKFATFLRDSGKKGKGVVEFVEGKGWVDEDGSVVEVVRESKRKTKELAKVVPVESTEESSTEEMEVDSKIPIAKDDEESPNEEDNKLYNGSEAVEGSEEDNDTSSESSGEEAVHEDREDGIPASARADSEDSSSVESLSEDDLDTTKGEPSKTAAKVDRDSSSSIEHGSSVGSSEDDSDHSKFPSKAAKTATSDDFESLPESESEDEPEEPQSATSRPQSSSGPGLTIKIPDSMTSTPITSSVHPLEALYKRKSDGSKTGPSFSFFEEEEEVNEDNEEIAVETHLQVPLTPFTQKDFEFRGIRSAAPTPDTAHPNKKFVWPTDNDDEEDEQASSPIRQNEKGKEKAEPESDFQKWFWENRGDVNRAWKKRRKVVAKEKRQRDNRKRQDRI